MKKTAITLAIAALALASCDENNEYSTEFRNNFLNSCQASSGGNSSYCSCMLNAAEEKYSESEFVALEQSIMNGDTAAITTIQNLAKSCQP